MYAKLFRHGVLPLLDVANRTMVADVLAALEDSQWYAGDRLHDIQRSKLDAILAWTRDHSPFYRAFWQSAPNGRRARSLYPQLDGLPVLTKDDLRCHHGGFPLTAYKGRVVTVRTSGSTGEPMVFLRSMEQESWFWALRFRMWEWGGFDPGEPYITLNLNPRTAGRKRIQDVLFRCCYHGFNANNHDVKAVLHDFEKKRVRHLVGYASSLYLLARAMKKLGLTKAGMRSVLSTGDTLFPSYRKTIEEVFGRGVVDYYGAGGEGFHLASQCEERSRYHLHIENSVIEVLRNGRPAQSGELGEIVVTQLDNAAMPLIRYGTQDVAVAAGQPGCPCGRQLPLVESVQGRVADIVFAPDGSALVVHFFTILFEHLTGVRQFQIVQPTSSQIVVRIVPGEDFDEATVERCVMETIERTTACSLNVDFDYVPEIRLSPSGKRRFVISEILPQPFAVTSTEARVRATAPDSGTTVQ